MAFPIRSRYELLGVMWVMATSEFSAEEMQACQELVARLAKVLQRRGEEASEESRDVERRLLTLLTDEPLARQQAAGDLADLGLYQETSQVSALVVNFNPTLFLAESGTSAGVLDRSVRHAAKTLLPRSGAVAFIKDRALVLIGTEQNSARRQCLHVARRILKEVHALAPAAAGALHMGVGAPVKLGQAGDSFEQACAAADISRNRKLETTVWDDYPLEMLMAVCVTRRVLEPLVPALLAERVAQVPTEVLDTVVCVPGPGRKRRPDRRTAVSA